MSEGLRLCRACNEQRPLSDFRRRGPSSGKRAGQAYGRCIKCRQEYDANRFSTEDPAPYLIQLCNHRQRYSSVDWSITKTEVLSLWFMQEGKCAITGRPMTCVRGKGTVTTNASIDRIDSSLGYNIDNVHLVCSIVNLMKHQLTMDELYDWCEAILRHRDDQD